MCEYATPHGPGRFDPVPCRLDLSSSSAHRLSAVRWPVRIGASGPRLQETSASTQPAALQPLHQPQEHPLPRIPRQQPVDQPPAAPHDLARHLDHRRTERRELHPQQRPLLGRVLWPRAAATPAPAAPSTPSGSTPGCAITMYAQLLTRSSTGVVSACTPPLSWAIRFSWSQRSLAENTISSAVVVAVVGDVEEVAILLEQPQLSLVDPQPLAEHDHAITSSCRRPGDTRTRRPSPRAGGSSCTHAPGRSPA